MALWLFAVALGFYSAQSIKTSGNVTLMSQTCAKLKNKQSHSVLAVEIGSPPQKMHLIADTGSSNVIVTHCYCKAESCSDYSSKCFETKNHRSSTFAVKKDYAGENSVVKMSFGSGDVYGVLGSEVIRVGRLSTTMHDSMVFMYDQNFDGGIKDFEGIIGLGLPYHEALTGLSEEAGASWLVEASVNRFSMCFDSIESDGVLRLNSQKQAAPQVMGSAGKLHWGLEFRGISVKEDNLASVIFCSDDEKQPGMESACGMIPDSGTTLMMGPENHIRKLYAKLCDEWPRCAKEFAEKHKEADEEAHEKTEDPNPMSGLVGDLLRRLGIPFGSEEPKLDPETQRLEYKKETFKSLLLQCSKWAGGMKREHLDAELPSVHFHVRGTEGNEQTLTVPASTYIIATEYLGGTVCMPMFGAFEYGTSINGPVWIVGTPLFYEYEAHYDISTTPPSMAFTTGSSCKCDDDSDDAQLSLVRKKDSLMRRLDQKIRMPRVKPHDPF